MRVFFHGSSNQLTPLVWQGLGCLCSDLICSPCHFMLRLGGLRSSLSKFRILQIDLKHLVLLLDSVTSCNLVTLTIWTGLDPLQPEVNSDLLLICSCNRPWVW